MWNNLNSIEILYKINTWLSVIFAFLAAGTGVLSLVANQQIQALKDEYKKAPPKFTADIKTAEDNQFYIVIQTENNVPFEYTYFVVTKENKIISALLIEKIKIFPTEKNKRFFCHMVPLHLDKVKDNYVELQLNYQSIYAAELNLPELIGKIVRRYELSEDKRYFIPLVETTQEVSPHN